MTLTPEQIAKGWKLHDGSDVCPIKDNRTKFRFLQLGSGQSDTVDKAGRFYWQHIIAYRIIEAHGADAEPARPTPFPADYSELVFDDAGWSQTIIVDGKRPEWLRDDDRLTYSAHGGRNGYPAHAYTADLAIRVRRREPKRETGECFLIVTARSPSLEFQGTIDLIDGKPDLSTLKIAEDAL